MWSVARGVGCYVEGTKWNENKYAKKYNEMYREIF